MLTCQQLTELVTDYTEGRLPLRRRLAVWFHLGMCSHCRTYLRQLRTARRLLGHLPTAPVPDALKIELQTRLRSLGTAEHRRTGEDGRTTPTDPV
jgi:anti-sigma factor RsiW